MKTACVTGHRPMGFPWKYGNENASGHLIYLGKLRSAVISLVSSGYSHFISGGALGADLDFAKTVLDIRKTMPITLEIAVPCPNQDLKWSDNDKKLYADIIKKADKVTLICNSYTNFCMQKRNEYMVNHSDTVLAVWNGEESGGTWNTIRYARKVGKEIIYILL